MKKKSHKRMMDGGMAAMGGLRGAEPPRKIVLPPRPPRGGRGGGADGISYMGGSPNFDERTGEYRKSEGGGHRDGNMASRPIPTNPIGRPAGGRVGYGEGIVGGLGPVAGLMGAPRGVPVAMKKGGAVKSKKMRGGGLARKGVGMALAKGGLAKRAGGCATRGYGRGKMV